jgi:hypothetical protein
MLRVNPDAPVTATSSSDAAPKSRARINGY